MSRQWYTGWYIGGNGVYRGTDDGSWEMVGRFDYHVNALTKTTAHAYAAVSCGVFRVDPADGTWLQLHDETVTEVLALTTDGTGVTVGCPYGIATADRDELGAYRWQFHSDNLTVNQRFTNVLLRVADSENRLIVGTEDGVLVYDQQKWLPTNLTGTAVRALKRAHGSYWAGTDTEGILRSDDGVSWASAGTGANGVPVFDLAATATGIVAGTDDGFLVGDGQGRWSRNGPGIRAAAVATHSELEGHWLAGAYPGGLWMTENSGKDWCQCGSFTRILAILGGGEG